EDAGRTRRRAARWVPRVACAFAALVAGFEIASDLPTMGPMSIALASGLVFAVALAAGGRDTIARIIACAAGLVALGVLVGDFGIPLGSAFGRLPGPLSALAYLLLAAAVLVRNAQRPKRGRPAELFAFAPFAVALYALL